MVEAGFRRSFIHGFVITFLKWFAIRVRKSNNDSISVFLVWLNLKFSEIFKFHRKVWYNNKVCKKKDEAAVFMYCSSGKDFIGS